MAPSRPSAARGAGRTAGSRAGGATLKKTVNTSPRTRPAKGYGGVVKAIRKVAVIGSGVMGAGIAAQVANAGVPVLLLDIVPQDAGAESAKSGKNRSVLAQEAIKKLHKINPAPLMAPENADLITAGNLEDHTKQLADCDWIIEVVVEKLDVKKKIYKIIEKNAKKGAIISSNTSTLPLSHLTAGMSREFKQHFVITHFFNPPRYMRLLELVVGPVTLPEVVDVIESFVDVSLGKSVVHARDTPGFIANRIGTYWLHSALVYALKQGVEVEAADAVLGKPMGAPKTGVFGLVDLVGLDLIPHVLESLLHALPESDDFHKLGPAPALLKQMIAQGYTGRKGKGGFYRLGANKSKEVISLSGGDYGPVHKPYVAAAQAARRGGLKALVTHDSPEGRYAWVVLRQTLAYAAGLVEEIAGNLEEIDRAMRLGYNWKYGPLELIDQLGTAWFAQKLRDAELPVPLILQVAAGRPLYRVHAGRKEFLQLSGTYRPLERPAGVLLLEDIKRASKPLMRNVSASVWDIGHGVACFEFHSKMNSFNPFILWLLEKAVRQLPAKGYKAMVIYNEGNNFSVGANLLMLLVTSKFRLWPLVRLILKHGQKTFEKIKYAPFPVVGAPSGMALGGGCEVLLHCHALESHAESYIGLVEVGVGIIPGWGGCKELLGRAIAQAKAKGPMPPVVQAFETIATAKVSKSAQEARKLLFLGKNDGITMNRDRVLANAKERALKMAENFVPPQPFAYALPGSSGAAALRLALHDFALKGLATKHDVTVGTQLAVALTGGSKGDVTVTLTEDDMQRMERKGLVRLAKTPGTRARIAYMLKRGKPLRN